MPWRLKGRDKFSTPQKKPTKPTKPTNSLWATDGAPSTMGSRTPKCAKAFTHRTLNRCPSTRWLSKCGRCSGAIYSQYNMGNLLSLSREGDITSSCKGIVDNLSMTYDGCRLVSVSDSAPGPSVTGSADFRDGVSEAVEYTYDRNGNMTSDLNRKVSLTSYNRQNQPARMIHAAGRRRSPIFLTEQSGEGRSSGRTGPCPGPSTAAIWCARTTP